MRLTTLTLALFPISAFAAGSETPATPTPSETTTVCDDGLVWDIATQSCMTPEQSTNDDSARLNDVRELAYEGQLVAALDVLRSLEDQTSPLALTYYGFVHRQLGETALGMTYYQAALQADPDNLLARSYMGQGYVATGQMAQAQEQLTQIRMRGGQDSWPEVALAQAIATGALTNY